MQTPHEKNQAKAKARWKRYRKQKNLNSNIKERHKRLPINEKTIKLFHREGYPVQLTPKSRKR